MEFCLAADFFAKKLNHSQSPARTDKEEHNGGDWCNNFTDGNYYITEKNGTPLSNTGMIKLISDCQDCKIKEETKNDETNSYVAYKCSFSNIRGLCVGGQNHGQFCGGNLDCPPKKHSDSTEDTVEYGVCVGAALDEGKVIPKNDTTGTGFGRGLERLLELFPAWFNTWEWKDNHYTEYLDSNQNKSQGQTGFHTFENKWDYTKGHEVKFDNPTGCSNYPTESCNPKANVDPKPPIVQFVDEQNKPITGNPTIKSDGSLNFILRFNAWADHDQMPLVRMAVDWGDGGDPYVMQGWFRNRKKAGLCGEKTDSNDTKCSSGSNCRLRFGNSSDACEGGYYQFTHIYECNKSAGCKFTPRVQVLDNWGWCNGTCDATVGGCWDDSTKIENQQSCSIDNEGNKDKHWTPFSGTIEITP